MRQGEATDYVFRPQDAVTGTMTGSERPLAAKFSPYNLTASSLTDAVQYADVDVRGGDFVDFPTKVGAHFQWAASAGYERRAYHPVNPVGTPNSWGSNYAAGNWNVLKTTHETCPVGWRRPTLGATGDTHNTQAASGSELMQSLFEVTFDSSSNNFHVGNHRYFGYYADGFFDRLPIETPSDSPNMRASSVVSPITKDAAYNGVLFTNPVTNASLFMPNGGSRKRDDGSLTYVGTRGYYWSGSSYSSSASWILNVHTTDVSQTGLNIYKSYGYGVRCVSE